MVCDFPIDGRFSIVAPFAWNGDAYDVHNQFVASDGRLRLEIIGDALVDSDLKRKVAELVPSLAAGKAQLASS